MTAIAQITPFGSYRALASCGRAIYGTGITSRITSKGSLDMPNPIASQYPYLLHTNRELGLMLAGRKPLAVFADGLDCFSESVVRYLKMFDRHVASRRLVRRDHFAEPSGRRTFILHTILFALPVETWRIEAMLELKAVGSWSPEHERREGELLGYEDWMNDFHLAQFAKS